MKILLSFLMILYVITGAGNTLAQTTDNACNCVLWARTQVPSLPTGISDHESKKRIINHYFPRVGAVAVHSYNHVSVVKNIAQNSDGSLKITIQEANYQSCQITSRTGMADGLGIIGYFDPNFVGGGNPPLIYSTSLDSASTGRQFMLDISGQGFNANSAQVILMGGSYCNSFAKCVIPTSVISNRSSSQLTAPMTINSPGKYTIYIFNSNDGRSSNGKSLTIY